MVTVFTEEKKKIKEHKKRKSKIKVLNFYTYV